MPTSEPKRRGAPIASISSEGGWQARQAVAVQPILMTTFDQHLGLRDALDTAVVRVLDLTDHPAGLVPPLSPSTAEPRGSPGCSSPPPESAEFDAFSANGVVQSVARLPRGRCRPR